MNGMSKVKLEADKVIVADVELTVQLEELSKLNYTIANLEKQKATLKEFIISKVESPKLIVSSSGTPIAEYCIYAGRRGADLKRLEKEYPEAYETCVTTGQPIKMIRMK